MLKWEVNDRGMVWNSKRRFQLKTTAAAAAAAALLNFACDRELRSSSEEAKFKAASGKHRFRVANVKLQSAAWRETFKSVYDGRDLAQSSVSC